LALGEDAGDLPLEEGRGDGVGGGQRTILVQSNCKRNKKVLIIINVSKSILLSIQLMQQGEEQTYLN
jgi:hypothetical protein